jgi:hypothetical protein
VAEREHVPHADIPADYDRLERMMLDDFYKYVEQRPGHYWVNWNMRDANYGFPALAHRYRVLKGQPVDIPDIQQVDLAALAPDIYGPNYVPVPRLENLLKINKITDRDFLAGSEEAAAFERGDYVQMHLSTLRKVDVIADILNRMWDGTLRTNASRKDMYGTSIGGWVESIADHWMYKLLGGIAILASLARLVALIP